MYVFEWHKMLEGREKMEDEQSGHPVSVKTDENVENIRTVVQNDCLSIRMVAK
jgi:hypothetical protein